MSENNKQGQKPSTSRRDFIRNGSLLVAGGAIAGGQISLASAAQAEGAHAYGDEVIKIGLIGCGGRGTGAVIQAMNTQGPTKLVAMADAFGDRLQSCLRAATGRHKDKVDVPKERQFVGFDGYKKVLETECDIVILATPPGFRPLHFEAAVKAGKHVFAEKPVATDAPGIRRFLAANELAKKNGTAVAIGLQRHHEERYEVLMEKLHEGIIGDIILGRAYWNGGGVWVRPRQAGQTELEYQMRNWYYFNWLCGDHIVEQHIHNLDVINWLKQGFPVKANAMGGREVRDGLDHGQIFDHFAVEYTYADGSKMLSQCRHIRGCWNSVSEHAHGTKGSVNFASATIYDADGNVLQKARGGGGHQEEHHDLFASLRKGEIPNEGEYGAKSTMTAILGRMAAYSGKEITWDEAINKGVALADVDSMGAMTDAAPLQPGPNGRYAVPVPGATKVLG